MKLQHNKANGQFFLNLPKSVVDLLGWNAKDNISIKAGEKQSLILRRE